MDVHSEGGFAPVEAYAVIGDCRTTALVARDGSIDWWALPLMDSPPVCAAVLDPDVGGRFTLAPADPDAEPTGQRYVDEGAVLETGYRVGSATVRVTDSLNRGVLGLLPWGELARRVDVEGGEVRMRWEFQPGHRFAGQQAITGVRGGVPVIQLDDQMMGVVTAAAGEPQIGSDRVHGEFVARPGEPALVAVVSADAEPLHLPPAEDILGRIDATRAEWRGWAERIDYDGPWRTEVVRSAMVLRLLTLQPTGAIMAAATTSLPESLDGSRNYDYRFSWVRDTSFALDALVRLGMPEEVHAAMSWLLDTVGQSAPDIRVFYSITGDDVSGNKSEIVGLRGYRGASPVNVGNPAAEQRQLGAYGDLLDAVWRYADKGNVLDPGTGAMLAEMADRVCEQWTEPGAGLWELPNQRHYTIARIACWVALDRAAQLAADGQLPDDHVDHWRAVQKEIRAFVDEHCWSERKQAYTFYADSDDLDCAVLLAARTGFCPPGDPRLAGTIDAIRRELTATGPLLYRYTGMRDREGAFVACSFWLVEALTHVGRLDEARETLEAMLARVSETGLLSEEIDPDTGHFLGNTPQALSHLALIGAVTGLAAALATPERVG